MNFQKSYELETAEKVLGAELGAIAPYRQDAA